MKQVLNAPPVPTELKERVLAALTVSAGSDVMNTLVPEVTINMDQISEIIIEFSQCIRVSAISHSAMMMLCRRS